MKRMAGRVVDGEGVGVDWERAEEERRAKEASVGGEVSVDDERI